MKDQLKLLEKLQQVDARLHQTQEDLTTLPAKLESLKDDVKRVAALLEKERGQLSDAMAYRADLEGTMKAEQEQLNKAKSKLSQVRTSKEYMATQREVEATRRSSGEREEELLKLMDAVDSFQRSIKVHEEELQALEKHVVEEEVETAARITELQGTLKEQEAERERMSTTIRKDVLRKYNAIRRRRDAAVVPARHGVCMGCNMALPPQLFNILQRGTTIEYCPSCQRIVYYEAEEESSSG